MSGRAAFWPMPGWAASGSRDLILLATSSPDDLFGTAPPHPRPALGQKNPKGAVAFDLTAACSGFPVLP